MICSSDDVYGTKQNVLCQLWWTGTNQRMSMSNEDLTWDHYPALASTTLVFVCESLNEFLLAHEIFWDVNDADLTVFISGVGGACCCTCFCGWLQTAGIRAVNRHRLGCWEKLTWQKLWRELWNISWTGEWSVVVIDYWLQILVLNPILQPDQYKFHRFTVGFSDR